MPPIELVGRRSRDSKTFQLDNGKRQVVFAPFTHYQDDQGAWQDVDLNFRFDGLDRLIDKHLISFRADASGLSVFHKPTGRGIRFNFPRRPDRVANRTAEWDLADGTTWRLTARKTGLKTEATVVAKRGPKTYTFSGTMLGGLAPPNADGNGNLVQPAGHFTIERPYVTGANGVRYETSGWSRTGGNISFSFDDTPLPAEALPYVIDPTSTFNVAASGDDGRVRNFSAAYPPAGTIEVLDIAEPEVIALKALYGADYYIDVPVIRWDTSSIPDDATVDSATFRGYVVAPKADDDNRSLTAEWYEHNGIGTEDWTSTVGTNAHAGTDITAITTGADNDFVLANVSNVNKAGYTGLRLHISGGAPPAENYVRFASIDHATLTEPRLIVEYTEAGGGGGGIDTRSKRASAIHVSMPWRDAPPLPDGSIDGPDRAHLAHMYSAFVAAGGTTHQGEAALSGSGAITLAAVATYAGASALAASVAVSPAARLTLAAASALAASGALVADATVIRRVDASLTVTAALSPTARMTYAGVSALASEGAFSPSAVATYAAASALAASGAIAPSESIRLAGVAALSGIASLAADGALVILGSVAISASATISPNGRATYAAQSALAASGELAPTARLGLFVDALLQGLGSLAADGTISGGLKEGEAALSGTASLAAVGRLGLFGQAALATSGTISSDARLTLAGVSVLATSGTLSPAAVAVYAVMAALPGVVVLAAEGTLSGFHEAAAALSAVASLAPNARLTIRAQSVLAASVTISPFGGLRLQASIVLAGSGSVTANALLLKLASASLNVTALIVASARATYQGEASLSVIAAISSAGRVTYSASASLQAIAELLADATLIPSIVLALVTGRVVLATEILGRAIAASEVAGRVEKATDIRGRASRGD